MYLKLSADVSELVEQVCHALIHRLFRSLAAVCLNLHPRDCTSEAHSHKVVPQMTAGERTERVKLESGPASAPRG